MYFLILLISYLILDLRRQARHLENEIDAKLVAFSKLGVNTGAKLVNSDEVPLLDEEHVFENMASEIETLLAKVGLNSNVKYCNDNINYIFLTVIFYK